MPQNIQVTTDEIHTLADGCTNTGTAVTSELNALQGKVQQVVSGSWVGQASASFDGYFREFNQGQKKIEEALRGISQQLHQAATSYEQTEEGIAGRFR
jgi:WXG100 family type VII secretion target